MKVGIIGIGKVGEAIAQGLLAAKDAGWQVVGGTTQSSASAKKATERLGLRVTTDSRSLASECDFLIVCVKPYQMHVVCQALAPVLREGQVVVSVAAAVTTAQVAEWTGGKAAVVRAMSNTPALIGEGMTVVAPGPGSTQETLDQVMAMFDHVGRTATAEERLMDAVTGLSGCGPAYVYMVIEALSEAGVSVGLPRETSTLLAAQTLLGAAKMVLERGVHPAALKDEVTTPAGCTIDGLVALEEGKLRATLIRAVRAATERSKTLSTE